jgi:D-proline reductase (dithiol) PrdB
MAKNRQLPIWREKMRLEDVSEGERKMLLSLKCPTFETHPWENGPPLKERRVAIVTTAGLHGRQDRPFQRDPDDFYRVIRGDVQSNDLVMSHIAASFDRTGFQRDWNVVFPIDRLREMVAEGIIGSLADFHYSYSSVRAQPDAPEPIREIASLLKKDNVNAVLLFPV